MMRTLPRMVLGPWHFLYIIAVLLLLLPAYAFVVCFDDVRSWYGRDVLGPSLRQTLGFTTTIGRHPAFPDCPQDVEYIDTVTTGGRFARAGIRAGDLYFRTCSFCQPDFYTLLDASRGYDVELDLLRDAGKGWLRADLVTVGLYVPRGDEVDQRGTSWPAPPTRNQR